MSAGAYLGVSALLSTSISVESVLESLCLPVPAGLLSLRVGLSASGSLSLVSPGSISD